MKFHLPFLVFLFTAAAMAGDVPALTSRGYRIPQPGVVLEFPRDHGNHPDYRIEWWYLTGHLFTEEGRRFGYQATFFRNALDPEATQSDEAFGTAQLYLAHMALADEETGRFHHAGRLGRSGWDAFASRDLLMVRNGDWLLKGPDPEADGILLKGSIHAEVIWSLEMRPIKPLVRFGRDGTSRKGPAPEARSYYLTYPLLETSGALTIGNRSYTVTGTSWMDHEIASTPLDPDYTGWDWIAIQLNDGWQVKAYHLRQVDGSPSPFSALIWIDPDGIPAYREVEDFTWIRDRFWKSRSTGVNYPVYPRITTRHPITGKDVTFQFVPLLENQELDLPGTTYWEGAGRVLDAEGMETGSAYLELVGYAGPIEGLR